MPPSAPTLVFCTMIAVCLLAHLSIRTHSWRLIVYVPPGGMPQVRRSNTLYSTRTRGDMQSVSLDAKNKGFGGFPYPTQFLQEFLKKFTPRALRPSRTITISRSRTITSRHGGHVDFGETWTYFSETFNAMVGRNSKFYSLSDEHLEELGGVEFRALNALLWILPLVSIAHIVNCDTTHSPFKYHFGVQAICFAVIAPYMSIPRWKTDFEPPNLIKSVNPVWYSLFQVNSVYTTTGMSLVDQSMVPFREAYPLVFLSTFLILAGNLAFVSTSLSNFKPCRVDKFLPYSPSCESAQPYTHSFLNTNIDGMDEV